MNQPLEYDYNIALVTEEENEFYEEHKSEITHFVSDNVSGDSRDMGDN